MRSMAMMAALSFAGAACAVQAGQRTDGAPKEDTTRGDGEPVLAAPTEKREVVGEAGGTEDTGEARGSIGEPIINCVGLNNVDCMIRCAQAGAPCSPTFAHPYSPSSGSGDLFACRAGRPTWVCSYSYSNGDKCAYVRPSSYAVCSYAGG